jgi:hypothetical protein
MVDTLAAMFPGAYFLHILRDGRSVVHSMMNVAGNIDEEVKADMTAGQFLPAWTRDFRKACTTWRDSVEAAMSAAEHHPSRCLTVRYEALLSDPPGEFRRIFAFIRAPFERKPVEFWQSKPVNSSFREASDAQTSTQPRWRGWSPEERRIFRTEAAPTLVKYGLASESEAIDDATAVTP